MNERRIFCQFPVRIEVVVAARVRGVLGRYFEAGFADFDNVCDGARLKNREVHNAFISDLKFPLINEFGLEDTLLLCVSPEF